jgi:DNA-binding MarR family transcriptional regulator
MEALASFRSALRRFLAFSESATKSAGVTVQQYQAMLAIRTSKGGALTMKELARELLLVQHGAVQLVNRMQAQGLVRRRTVPEDRRLISVSLTGKGIALLNRLASAHIDELVRHRRLLLVSLRRLNAIELLDSNSEET